MNALEFDYSDPSEPGDYPNDPVDSGDYPESGEPGDYPVDPIDPGDFPDPGGPGDYPIDPIDPEPDPNLLVEGSEDDDLLYGGFGDDTFRGFGGNDIILAEDGNDYLEGGDGNDSLDGGQGDDTFVGGRGNDTYMLDSSGDVVEESANAGIDSVIVADSYVLGANLENLSILSGADFSGTGNALANSITGNAGANILDGGAGADTLVGGAGHDTYVVDNTLDRVVEASNSGTDTVRSFVAHTLGANVEHLVLSGGAAISGTGNALANSITGNAGANILDGGAGADTLVGGAGHDTYVIDNTLDRVVETSNSGTDTVRSFVAHTLGANVEHLVLSGGAAISGTGNALANSITGNALANNLNGGDGNDTLNGGDGNDTLAAGRGNDRVSGGSGNDLLVVDWTSLSGAVITHKIDRIGSSFAGVLTAKSSVGTTLSQVTLDSIESFRLNGKTWTPQPPKPAVLVSRIGNATATSEQGGSVEYSVVLQSQPFEPVAIEFKSSDDTEGKVLNPRLVFNATNWNTPQKLTIKGVDDYLDDSNVAYTINGKIVTQDLNYNRLTVPALNLINNDDAEDKPLNLKGTPDVDRLVGKNGNDRIYGGGDQDSLLGGRGDDLLYGQEDDDRMFGEEGNDKLYGGYDDDRMEGGVGADSLFGEQGRDTLFGSAGNDYLDGGLENDSMSGGAGNDTYRVDSAGDVINDLGSTTDVDTVEVMQTINYTLAPNIENAAITTGGNGNLTGNTLNNGLTGNDGRNVIDGGVGNDRLDGAGGADSLVGGAGNDVFLGGMGNDTMRGGDGVDVADFLQAGVDLRIDLNTGRITGEGTDLIFDIENILAGDGQDTLLGNAAGNDLDGGAGIDNLNGGAGNDTLAGCFFGANGGRGETDTLTGGAGIDVFQLGWSSGRFYDDGIASNGGRNDYVLIADFTVGQDRLQLDGARGNYLLGASPMTNVAGSGLFHDSNANARLDATDELMAIIRSASSNTQLNTANTINTAQFV